MTTTKTRKPLTVRTASAQVRRIVDRVMPKTAFPTVESRLGHDLSSDTPTVITVITFPENQPERLILAACLHATLPQHDIDFDLSRITITRPR